MVAIFKLTLGFLVILKCTFLVMSLKIRDHFTPDYQEIIQLDIENGGQYTRDMDLAQLFPISIWIRFNSRKGRKILYLKKNDAITEKTSIYTEFQGKIIKEYVVWTENTVFYQDIRNGAAFVVEFNETHIKDFVGTVHIESEEFWLERWSSHSMKYRLLRRHAVQNMQMDYATREKRSLTSRLKHILRKSEQRRQQVEATKNVVELLVVADYSVYKFWYDKSSSTTHTHAQRDKDAKQSVRQFYAFVINAIDMRYKSIKSSKISLSVVFAGIFIATESASSTWTEGIVDRGHDSTVDATLALQRFHDWLTYATKLPSRDHAMLFTKYNLKSNAAGKGNVGLAYDEEMCKSSSQSVVEDYFTGVFMATAAHELGHSLGASHDGLDNDCPESDGYIMAAKSSVRKGVKALNSWKFSSCSITKFETFIEGLERDGLNCMETLSPNHDPTALTPYDKQKPGQIYTVDKQCQYFLKNSKSHLCREMYKNKFSGICTNMLCSQEGADTCAVSYALDGTTCGNKKWCSTGHCVSSSDAPSVEDACPFGDTPGFLFTRDGKGYKCADIIGISVSYCSSGWFNYCCATCLAASGI